NRRGVIALINLISLRQTRFVARNEISLRGVLPPSQRNESIDLTRRGFGPAASVHFPLPLRQPLLRDPELPRGRLAGHRDTLMTQPLHGRTIALAEGRQLEELAQMLEKEGATTVRCPLISILDAPDEAPVLAWLRDLMADRFAVVVLMTGEGLRRL